VQARPRSDEATDQPLWIARGSGLTGSDWLAIARDTHLETYGDAWLVDRSERPAPADAYAILEREPNLFESWLHVATERIRSIGERPDPFLTWELRRHVGQPPPALPRAPSTLDEIRIAHNATLDAGDAPGARRLRARLVAALDPRYARELNDGHRLLGTRITRGIEPRLEIWIEAAGPLGAEVKLAVDSKILRPAPFSLIPRDAKDQQFVIAPTPPATLWLPGYIYRLEMVILHRPGLERFTGRWSSPLLRPATGSAHFELGSFP
jgi:hypothetical protein